MEPEPEMVKYPEVCLNTDLILSQFEGLCEELICSICLDIACSLRFFCVTKSLVLLLPISIGR